MRKRLEKYFSSVNIEYFSILSYKDCREINKRIIDRESFLPKSVIVYLLPYYAGETENLSIYAAALDYHIAIKEINEGIERELKNVFPTAKIKGYGDHSPIDERHAALIGGLGLQGDNGLLINEKYGSFVFIADVVSDVPPELLDASDPIEYKHCEGCGLCRRACPTEILSGEGSDCLSAITQRKGELTEEEKELMIKYNTVWGCDICQRACPHNRSPINTPVEFFHRDRIPKLTKEVLDSLTDTEFELRAFAWRKKKTVERNLDIVIGK